MNEITCSLPKNKKSYTVNFRHPIMKEKSGKYGLKIHRSLGTRDLEEATKKVNQLKKLINDEYWWDRSKRQEAYTLFSSIVVDAFYDCMDLHNPSNQSCLDLIYLPTKKDGYIRTLLLGPSGTGKTSLLRYIAGTSGDKFPTTASNRTTTCRTELILSDEKTYEVVVTFMSRALTEAYVQECVEAAIQYCIQEKCVNLDRKTVSEKLLIHQDLAFRLSYILGDLSLVPSNYTDDLDFDTKECEDTGTDESEYCQNIDALVAVIEAFVDRVQTIAKELLDQGINLDDTGYNLQEIDSILQLEDDIVDEIVKRFALISHGEKLDSRGKWVNAWHFKTENRDEFIKTVKLFSSNAKKMWGGLLSPIVDTMRIKGYFKPANFDEPFKMVLFDGQGLGHKVTATSLSNELVNYLKISDAVILVDNAKTPMMANVKMALKSVIEYGLSKKISIAYTHVDQIEGENFTGFADKRDHTLVALDSYLSELKKVNPHTLSDLECASIRNATFFFSELNQLRVSKISAHYLTTLFEHLRTLLEESVTPDDMQLTYDGTKLLGHIKLAIDVYRQNWGEKIGYPCKTQKTEYWSRIKALCRRLAYFNQDHYNFELMPLAELRQELATQLNIFLNQPFTVMPEEAKEECRVTLINQIKESISNKIWDFVIEKMWRGEQLNRWVEAYNFSGKNSSYFRAAKINEIFDIAAPKISDISVMADGIPYVQKEFLNEIIAIVKATLQDHHSELREFQL